MRSTVGWRRRNTRRTQSPAVGLSLFLVFFRPFPREFHIEIAGQPNSGDLFVPGQIGPRCGGMVFDRQRIVFAF